MRKHRLLWVGVMGSLVVAGGCSVASNDAPAVSAPASQPAVAAVAPASAAQVAELDVQPAMLDVAVREVRNAEDLESAVAAYGRGVAIDPDSLALNEAFVLRMIEFEVPEQAVDAARKVLARQPADGLSRGVLAFTEARQGQMNDALTNIALAVKHAPDDAFVQDTAGHLLAWYDRATPTPVMPVAVQEAVRRVHLALDNEVVFGAAYQDAALYYLDQRRQQQAAQTNGGGEAGPAPAVSVNGPVGGTAAGPVMFAPTGEEPAVDETPVEEAEDYATDLFPPLAYAWDPGFFGAGLVVVIPPVVHALPPIHHRHHDHDEHHVLPPRRHDAEVTFRDRFFGRGYRSVEANGGRGVTALAYLRDRFPGSFPAAGAGNGRTAISSSDLARPGRPTPVGSVSGAFAQHAGVFREDQLRVGTIRVPGGTSAAGVSSGSGATGRFMPSGPIVGPVNIPALGSVGTPPGFVGPPPQVVTVPSAASGSHGTPVRSVGGATGGRGGSTGGR